MQPIVLYTATVRWLLRLSAGAILQCAVVGLLATSCGFGQVSDDARATAATDTDSATSVTSGTSMPPKITRDLVYATVDRYDLKLDLYVPSQVDGPPLVVWIHGGGWRQGSRAKPPIRKLTECGYALASISYRFTDRAKFPAQIHDCKAAIRWLRANADQHGYSAKWIGVAGSSAGGHLALLLGTSSGVAALEGTVGSHLEQSTAVQAIVDYYGPSDFELRGRTQPERAYSNVSGSFALLGGVEGQRLSPVVEREASPAAYVGEGDPPLLMFHGTADETVLMDQSEHMLSVYHGAGLDADLIKLVGAGHGGMDFFWGKHFDATRDFLDRHRLAKPDNSGQSQ